MQLSCRHQPQPLQQWRVKSTASMAVRERKKDAQCFLHHVACQLDLLRQCSMYASYAQETDLGTRLRLSRQARLGDGVVCQDTSATYPTHTRIYRRRCLLYFTPGLQPDYSRRGTSQLISAIQATESDPAIVSTTSTKRPLWMALVTEKQRAKAG
jgi:hypothetical protein